MLRKKIKNKQKVKKFSSFYGTFPHVNEPLERLTFKGKVFAGLDGTRATNFNKSFTVEIQYVSLAYSLRSKKKKKTKHRHSSVPLNGLKARPSLVTTSAGSHEIKNDLTCMHQPIRVQSKIRSPF